MDKHLHLAEVKRKLEANDSPFLELFNGYNVSIELYAPNGEDLQKPHDRDELYVVVSGSGTFRNGAVITKFAAGDLLFVPAEIDHRFETFTEDFATWVIFVGPVGGSEL